jgi:hypothetical protein
VSSVSSHSLESVASAAAEAVSVAVLVSSSDVSHSLESSASAAAADVVGVPVLVDEPPAAETLHQFNPKGHTRHLFPPPLHPAQEDSE